MKREKELQRRSWKVRVEKVGNDRIEVHFKEEVISRTEDSQCKRERHSKGTCLNKITKTVFTNFINWILLEKQILFVITFIVRRSR